MKVFLTDEEVIELAYDALDMNCPNPDKVHDIALKMDMVHNEDLNMYEDVEDVYMFEYVAEQLAPESSNMSVDEEKVCYKAMEEYANQQNTSLKLELQKQKELNAELVDVLEMFFEKDRIPAVHGAMPVGLRSFRERAEDLIKKSKES